MRASKPVCSALLLATAFVTTAAAPGAKVFELHDQGYGPAHVGMSVQAAERALSTRLVAADDSSPADGCWHLKPAQGHDGVQFMIRDGVIARASLWGEPSAIRTVRGVGLGDDEAKVRRLYGPALKVEPHAYDGPAAHYLSYWTRKATRGVRFETDNQGKVAAIHAGDESIELAEGCS